MEDTSTTSKIAMILEILKDGQWHALKEIQTKMGLNEDQTHQTVAFLKEYSFIIMDETKKKMKLQENVRKFLTQTTTS